MHVRPVLHVVFPLAALLATAVALPAAAAPVTYGAVLSGAAEAPPNASPATGNVTVVVDDATRTLRISTTFSGLLGTTTASHIHCCTAAPFAGNVGVATRVPNFPGFPTGITAGAYDATFDMNEVASWNSSFVTANGGSTASAFSALLGGFNSGRAYYNIHTTAFPGGEIRGFLTAATAVPEPATAWLAVGALALAAAARRRTPTARG